MPIVEYPAGAASRGDRPHGRRVEPGVAGADARPQGRPERALRRPRRHRVRAARLLRQPDRDADLRRARGGRPALQQHAHDGALLAEPRLHRHRAQPPQQRHGLHHRVRHRLPGLQRDHAVRERDALGDAARARLRHVHGRQVAPHAEQSRRPRPGPYDRWPLGRGFQRFYGFLGGDTSQWYPELVYDNHPVEPPRTPEEGYHLTEDLVDKSIEFITDLRQIDPDKPFYLHLCFGATHAPHHVPKEWADRYAGQFDDGWDAYREQVFARQKELGILPADAELSRHDPDVPEWESLSPEARRLSARMMEVFAGFLSHTDHHLGRLLDYLRDAGRPRQHDRHGHLRQRRQRRGRPDRDDERGAVLQQRPGDARGEPGGHRRDRRPGALQPLPVGLDVRGQHARSGAGSARRTAAARPTRSSSPGRPGVKARGEVRTQYAHIIDMVPTVLDLLGVEPPAAIRGVTQAPIEGVSFAHALDDAAAPEPAPHPVLRDARPPGHLQGRLARRLPVARPLVRRGRHGLRQARSRPRRCRRSTPPAGSSTTSTRTRPRTGTSRRSAATSSSR